MKRDKPSCNYTGNPGVRLGITPDPTAEARDRTEEKPMKSLVKTMIAAFAYTAVAGAATAQQRPSVTFAMPGIPPVFVNVQPLVAQQEKLFEKYGVNVTLRPFDTGAAAARAVVAGDIDFAISPTGLLATMISNANVNLVAVYGYEKPTWRLAS